ncbi:VWA domain-containing protein [Myxococcus sp. K15C18031901]|uniref:vWA domain-containing protein n=1 Tax=Myxococcus dinghuensis TaxID=2906761 RepID=UPI0020A7B18E|nr:vWA domain-containing protein [Myxococcus dinghuensis]MCP3099943.1 VWA domain-containing protein [Myxococcus dinghuensis]
MSTSVVDNRVEIVFSFDTTGSMYPCLAQVRTKLRGTVSRLMKEIPGIRIGIIAHGDYCDAGSTYVTKVLDLSDDVEAVVRFVDRVGQTGGGDAPECYELVLREAQSLSWTAGYTRALVLIGDDVPHPPASNPKRLDWRKEVDALGRMGVPVYGVQALARAHATPFYRELAEKSGGFHLSLAQFAHVTDMLLAVCYKQSSDARLQAYEAEVVKQGRMNRGLDAIFGTMLGRSVSASFGEADLRAVPPGRFQVLEVDRDMPIKELVAENGLAFKTGRGFYEFTKTETIQGHKEVVLMDRKTGDLFSGERARELLCLPPGETVRIRPANLEKYVVFVQSTSANRKLVGASRFLYEVEDWAGAKAAA